MPPYIDLDVGDIHYFQRTEFSKLVKTDKINNIENKKAIEKNKLDIVAGHRSIRRIMIEREVFDKS